MKSDWLRDNVRWDGQIAIGKTFGAAHKNAAKNSSLVSVSSCFTCIFLGSMCCAVETRIHENERRRRNVSRLTRRTRKSHCRSLPGRPGASLVFPFNFSPASSPRRNDLLAGRRLAPPCSERIRRQRRIMRQAPAPAPLAFRLPPDATVATICLNICTRNLSFFAASLCKTRESQKHRS